MLLLFQLCFYAGGGGENNLLNIFYAGRGGENNLLNIFYAGGGGENIFLTIFYAGGGKNIHLKFAQWDVTGYLARPWHGQGQN